MKKSTADITLKFSRKKILPFLSLLSIGQGNYRGPHDLLADRSPTDIVAQTLQNTLNLRITLSWILLGQLNRKISPLFRLCHT